MSYANITINTNIDANFVSGQFVQLINSINDYIFAQVLSYDANTGVMVVSPTQSVGSGTYNTWEVVTSGNIGESSLFIGTSNSSISLPLS
jgi:hypothetical protein